MSNSGRFEDWGERRHSDLTAAEAAVAAGEVRFDMSCHEARVAWFAMAHRMYVGNDPAPSIPTEIAVGYHVTGCETSACQMLANAYWDILRPSQPGAADLLVHTLRELEHTIFPGGTIEAE